ncbi:MAG: hypothetical protein ABR507_04250 [Actinomycetota bacterium]
MAALPQLPYAIKNTSGATDGRYIYLFGGTACPATSPDCSLHTEIISNQILKFDTVTNAISAVGATLPEPRYGTSAIWAGGYAYIFGGCTAAACQTSILRYDPVNDVVTTMAATLPDDRGFTNAVWSGKYAYILSGGTYATAPEGLWLIPGIGNSGYGTPAYLSWGYSISRYDPATDTLTVMNAKLWDSTGTTSAVWANGYVYVFDLPPAQGAHYSNGTVGIDVEAQYQNGTMSPNVELGKAFWRIARYDPATDSVTEMSAKMDRYWRSAIFDGNFVYLFGGHDETWWRTAIVRYSLKPGAPQHLIAQPGPTFGKVTIQWDPPGSNTMGSSVTSYKIYAAWQSGFESLKATVPAGTTTYVDNCPGGRVCYYQVRAVNSFGEGVPSSEAFVPGWSSPT